MTLEALNPSSFESLPFSLRSIYVHAQVCMCVHKSLCGVGTSSVAQWLRLGFQCRGPSVISGCRNSARLGIWQKKSLCDIVFLFPLHSADSSPSAGPLSPLPLYLVLPPLPTAPESVLSLV